MLIGKMLNITSAPDFRYCSNNTYDVDLLRFAGGPVHGRCVRLRARLAAPGARAHHSYARLCLLHLARAHQWRQGALPAPSPVALSP